MTRIPRPTTIYLAAATAAAAMHCVGQYVIGLDGWSIVYGVFIGMVFNIAMARWLSP